MSNLVKNLTRNQLAEFLPNARAVRAFEQLLAQIADLNPDELIAIKEVAMSAAIEAGTGSAKAQAALDVLSLISSSLQELALRPNQAGDGALESALAALRLAQTSPPVADNNLLVADSILLRRNHPQGRVLGVAETQWNPTVGTIETRINDEMVLQHGQEVVRRMVNNTASTIVPGQVIAFDSTSGDPEAPNCRLFIADGSISPLLVSGVATTTAAPGQVVYVTSYGVVHDINTSSFVGPIVYASATTPGALTSTPPTAPNVWVPVASVLAVSPTAGHIFVNPARAPRLYYGVFSDSTTQSIAAANTPQLITLNTTNIASGFTRGTPTSRVVAANNGVYNFQFSLQMVSSSSASIKAAIWARVNGVDVTNSATEITIKSNSDIIVPAWNFTQPMLAGDYFELVMAADSTQMSLAAVAAQTTPYARPAIPSVILSVTQANQ